MFDHEQVSTADAALSFGSHSPSKAEAVDAIRARDRAEAITKIEELRSMHLMRAFHTSALWEHYAWKRRGQG
ncbi:hypothetical protein LM241_01785 [Pseudomonas aeruginosa]|uniref:hypothetical protein n=1 Tax=Pseudomonas aeruginosa TaxID=287 RepID=UPI0004F32F07|nr:hypothetical protein [Pseudomonas aeruginosa]KXC75859.1 hypothetical protein AW897_11580 [Pseudomonas aeruginosa]KXC91065.1 hypothetical protein AW899_14115 [Pseudomonas aeruginosa]KXC93730.1 hypothetical protein AW898_13065 [Pseudomonas aeruginosa]KXD02180.1 hypothetical protein AW900_12580 [Pseudomonas aeruginosa]KXD11018.1 hypothetical protein AW901_13030 [Pseudomonas aeruginosa]